MKKTSNRGRTLVVRRTLYIYPVNESEVFAHFDQPCGPFTVAEAIGMKEYFLKNDPDIKLLITDKPPTPVPQLRPAYVGSRKDLNFWV